MSTNSDSQDVKCGSVVLDYIRATVLEAMNVGMRGLWVLLDCGHKCSLSTLLRISDEDWGRLMLHSGLVRTDGIVKFKRLQKELKIKNSQCAVRSSKSDGSRIRLTFIRFEDDILGSQFSLLDKEDEAFRPESSDYTSEKLDNFLERNVKSRGYRRYLSSNTTMP